MGQTYHTSPRRPTRQQKIRRRNRILLLLLLLAAGIILLVCCQRSSDSEENQTQTAQESAVSISQTQSTQPVEESALAATGAPTETTALTLPVEPDALSVTSCELDVTPILQEPELPTGCEVTALTMALQYAGYDIDKITLADKYLVCADPYTATFGEAFIGSPHDETAWGCYAPVIAETAESYIAAQGGTEQVQDLTGCSLKTLLQEVANGTPVVTWATISMTSNVEERYYWTTDDGEDAVFLINEHCVLLTGYDLEQNIVIVCDPLEGRMEYDMDVFEDRYEKVYQQAVILREAETESATEENPATEETEAEAAAES